MLTQTNPLVPVVVVMDGGCGQMQDCKVAKYVNIFYSFDCQVHSAKYTFNNFK